MSFSGKVKRELSEIAPNSVSALSLELAALISYARKDFSRRCLLQTEHRFVIDRAIDFLVETCAPILTLTTSRAHGRSGAVLYSLFAQHPQDFDKIQSFLKDISLEKRTAEGLDTQDAAVFLRGSFLACGSMNNPNQRYHLEFVTAEDLQAHMLSHILVQAGFPVRIVKRGNYHILYFKDSYCMEDLLTYMGATNASLHMMNIKVLKDVRNKVNRVTNCETANIDKTVTAAMKQIGDIKVIADKKGLDALPNHLREVALLRIQNPDLSLEELAKCVRPPLSRSGIYHRFKKISEIAQYCKKSSNKN